MPGTRVWSGTASTWSSAATSIGRPSRPGSPSASQSDAPVPVFTFFTRSTGAVMEAELISFSGLVLMFVLGLRHGLDPDHIACIDGLTWRAISHEHQHAHWIG